MGIRSHTFSRRRKYLVRVDEDMPDDLDGYVDWERKVLAISPDLKGRALLETVIHEALHIELPSAPEFVVTRVARYVAALVWRIGYRLPHEEQ